MFASVAAWLYLMTSKRLKQKQLGKVLGRLPNIEKLEQMNMFGMRSCFVFLTFGLASGLGFAFASVKVGDVENIGQWLFDSKIVLTIIGWILLSLTTTR